MTKMVPRIHGLCEIAASYDVAICDVWGVVHNGRDAFPMAADAMRRFRARRGPVVLLSNAPRLADGVEAQFDRIGVPRDFYDAIMTSGEAAHADLVARTPKGRPLRMFYLGPSRDNPLFRGLDVQFTNEDEAEIVFCTGLFDDETEAPDDYRPMLQRFLNRGLAFLCANPDIVVQRGDRLLYCAGAIARLYELMGGQAVYYGKPHPSVFEKALEKARSFGAAAKPIVIGDGLETDIAGANRLGLDALFVASGIHGAELRENPQAIDALLRKSGAAVRAWAMDLRW
jgi:HAD superfamily hydrolase (TIGR01459 family)